MNEFESEVKYSSKWIGKKINSNKIIIILKSIKMNACMYGKTSWPNIK